ncbi:hypothetical protein ACLMJK_009321 [Lecanora helva]
MSTCLQPTCSHSSTSTFRATERENHAFERRWLVTSCHLPYSFSGANQSANRIRAWLCTFSRWRSSETGKVLKATPDYEDFDSDDDAHSIANPKLDSYFRGSRGLAAQVDKYYDTGRDYIVPQSDVLTPEPALSPENTIGDGDKFLPLLRHQLLINDQFLASVVAELRRYVTTDILTDTLSDILRQVIITEEWSREGRAALRKLCAVVKNNLIENATHYMNDNEWLDYKICEVKLHKWCFNKDRRSAKNEESRQCEECKIELNSLPYYNFPGDISTELPVEPIVSSLLALLLANDQQPTSTPIIRESISFTTPNNETLNKIIEAQDITAKALKYTNIDILNNLSRSCTENKALRQSFLSQFDRALNGGQLGVQSIEAPTPRGSAAEDSFRGQIEAREGKFSAPWHRLYFLRQPGLIELPFASFMHLRHSATNGCSEQVSEQEKVTPPKPEEKVFLPRSEDKATIPKPEGKVGPPNPEQKVSIARPEKKIAPPLQERPSISFPM